MKVDVFPAVLMIRAGPAIEFSKLTEENIRQRLEILFKEKVAVSAAIMANIKSGQIQLKVMSERE
ncbi:MAG: hypothetical protein AVO38_01685 [delta proteobacterium ML8_D]|nr:MAG: hypothetical protein AVO38_01685 [delta proteobacterium ML8_D]